MSGTRAFARLLGALLLGLGLTSLLSAQDAPDQGSGACVCPDEVTLAEPAWVRLPPPNLSVTAAYMTLGNRGDDDLTVVAAESPIAGTVELHEHLQDAAGVMRMRQVASLALPAGGSLAMEPGGFHLMLIGLHQPLAEGETVPVILHLADGRTLEVAAEVRRAAPGRDHDAHHHHGHRHH
ncbi:copper chaperone PCu(A)C [Thioalkalivibrio sp.]|uniref:copper chaperone PCu(A)C n=1 Tax=Thioalkalivibrio sp. TaxID=2093813 RepID=UPI0012D646BA|nr:copper chaperone PCu(A)C [Thioalkalivibrio sp.]TVP76160.1 MAG: copper chaperone PCu(A)C [Thioalkalivibrio sp.]